MLDPPVMVPSIKSVSFGLFAFLLAVTPGFARQFDCDEVHLLTSDSSSYMQVGTSVAIDGDTAVFGVQNQDVMGSNAGAAYVFERQAGTWVETQILYAADADAGDNFGSDVAIQGDRLVVGAAGDDERGSNAGAVYLFERSGGGWVETRKFILINASSNDQFGTSVDIDGDVLIGGAPYYDIPTTNAGSVFVFERLGTGNWIQRYRIEAFDPGLGDRFGWDCAIVGDWVLVGAPWDDDSGTNAGSAYGFLRNQNVWDQRTRMLPLPGSSSALFGRSIAATPAWCAVGSAYDSSHANQAGSVTMHELSGAVWIFRDRLLPQELEAGDRFGIDIAMSGDLMVIGADQRNVGEAFIYRLESGAWQKYQAIAPQASSSQYFGQRVALSGNEVLIGAPGSDSRSINAGAGFQYTIQGLVRSFGSGSPGTQGFVPEIVMTGCAAEGKQVRLAVKQALGGTVGVLVSSRDQMQFPIYGGFLYAMPPYLFTNTFFLSGAVAGEGEFTLDSQPFGAGMSGIRFFLQAGILDPGALGGVALTSAAEVSFR